MRKIALIVSGMVVLGSLPSCYSLSKEECIAANWRVIGDTDGAAGRDPQSRFAEHVKSCERVKIVPDQTTWYQGFQEGVKRYCTPLSGAQHGEAGDTYNNVCPPQAATGFLQGYALGKRVYEVRQRKDSVDSSIRAREAEIDQAYFSLKTAKDDERRNLQRRIDDNDFEIRRLRRESDDLRYELADAEAELADFRMSPMAVARPAR
ncbi:DUF2799 domain-containing protein [Rhizobium helianthi]|uniref:DUF2799 domain-containing protein n=1 Tax=Rhizobium helianthi TaxID=1132695 RepID=A0ABW4M6P8_9HYPH